MKFRTKRQLQHQARVQAPRIARRAKRSTDFDLSDATWEVEQAPEAVFDRLSGPYGAFDEET